MARDRVVVIGAGVGGLAAAVDLARRGADVTVVERAAAPGGKMRQVAAGSKLVDGGPTVFTMRWIFESLYADAGARLEDALDLVPADVLARHAWRSGGRLDLYADAERSADAIGEFAGAADARGYREFCARSAAAYRTMRDPFIAAQRPSMLELTRRLGIGQLGELWRAAPFSTLWKALDTHFRDPRLRQLFARYATYVGSSPLRAPATLMLIAHVEQEGVWLVRGGIHRVAVALADLGRTHGARYRYGCGARRIDVAHGRVSAVELDDGERLPADAVVYNGDASALAAGLLGDDARSAARRVAPAERSLSAITWCIDAVTRGFPLEHHNVFFADDYAREFDAIFRGRTVTEAPTAYVCAQDRGAAAPARAPDDRSPERLLVLVNAPADGDARPFGADEVERVACRAFALMRDCGLEVDRTAEATAVTTPAGFERLFPASGGALYGRANHGPFGSFRRPGAATRVPGLYLAGGSAHPGAGVPMAAMSGRLAAARLLEDGAKR